MKKVLLFLGVFFILFPVAALKDNIDKISIDVNLLENGSADITETWYTEVATGTENFRPFYNLENSVISNFTVSDETGKKYEFLSYWDTSKDFQQKAYRNGIVYANGNGVELCWGIGSYGYHTYQLKYNISNFVFEAKKNR